MSVNRKEASLVIIKYELQELGLRDASVENLLQDAYIQSLVATKQGMEQEFVLTYLRDIQRRLKLFHEPRVEAQARGKRTFVVRQRNMPVGVEFENESFISFICVGDVVVAVPAHADLDTHLQMRQLMLRKREELGKHPDAVRRVQELGNQLAGSFAIQEQLAEMAEIATPKKARTSESFGAGTPMTAPHTSMSGSDIVKLRDKYFARIPLFSEFIEAPKRDTKSDSQLDATAIRAMIDSVKSEVDNPALSKERKAEIVAQVRKFAESLLACPPKPAVASTPQPDRSLPQEVRTRGDGRFYSVVNVFEEAFQMPSRTTVKEVLDDRCKFDQELKRVRSLISTSKSPNLTAHKSTVLSSMSRFAKSLTATPRSSDTPIHRVREKFYSSLDVMGQSVSTPVRATESEVVADKETAQEVISAMHAAGKEVVMAEIRARWNNADKTPRKL